MLAIQSQMVDVNKLARRWLNPIRKAIDDDPRNLIHSEKWYRIVAVLTEIMKDQMVSFYRNYGQIETSSSIFMTMHSAVTLAT